MEGDDDEEEDPELADARRRLSMSTAPVWQLSEEAAELSHAAIEKDATAPAREEPPVDLVDAATATSPQIGFKDKLGTGPLAEANRQLAYHARRTMELEQSVADAHGKVEQANELFRLQHTLLRGEVKYMEERLQQAEAANEYERKAAEAAALLAAQAESQLDALKGQSHARDELEAILRQTAEAAAAKSTEVEERMAEMVAEERRRSLGSIAEANAAQQQVQVLMSERAGAEELLQSKSSECDALKQSAVLSSQRIERAEAARDEAMRHHETLKAQLKELSLALTREKKRAELAEQRESRLKADAAEERNRLVSEIENGRKLRRGLEAQVGALRIERRNQVVGYCVEQSPRLLI